MKNTTMTITRCAWANPANPRYLDYHDTEWGVPCHDERRLFEMLNLEGAQAGLSWETILNKRDTYRAAFDDWDAEKIAAYGPEKVAQLLADPGIVRNRLKVAAAITNAQAYLRLRAQGQTLDSFLWAYVDGQPIVCINHVQTVTRQVPRIGNVRVPCELGVHQLFAHLRTVIGECQPTRKQAIVTRHIIDTRVEMHML